MVPEPSLAAKIDKLFDTFHPIGEPQHSPQMVAEVVSSALGVDIPAQTIDDLRRGRYDGPVDTALLTAIAEHFQVPAGYLTGAGEIVTSVDEQLELLTQLRELGVTSLAYRGAQLDQQQIRGIVAELLQSRPSGDTTKPGS